MVFMNSTCFGEDMMLKIAAKCEKMAPESWVITYTKRLPSVHFDVLEECRLMQSWWVGSFFFVPEWHHTLFVSVYVSFFPLILPHLFLVLLHRWIHTRFAMAGESALYLFTGRNRRTGKQFVLSARRKSRKWGEWKKRLQKSRSDWSKQKSTGMTKYEQHFVFHIYTWGSHTSLNKYYSC